MGIIWFLSNWIPYSLKGIIQFPCYPGIGSSDTPSFGFSSTVFLFFCVFFCWFQIYWSHSSVVPYWMVFCDITRQVFLSSFLEYVEMILTYSIAYPIKYHVYCSGCFLFCSSIHDCILRCVVRCHLCALFEIWNP